jgi:hypothetical protein
MANNSSRRWSRTVSEDGQKTAREDGRARMGYIQLNTNQINGLFGKLLVLKLKMKGQKCAQMYSLAPISRLCKISNDASRL